MTMSNTVPAYDQDARTRIITENDRNFFVAAGAGSGKTSVLVDRMVNMVEQGMEIEKICAITYTKAAAEEFYRRFCKKLSDSDTQLAADALKNVDQCFMGTIDAFCRMVLSEHPAEAKIPSDASIIDDAQALAFCREEWRKFTQLPNGDELKPLYDRFVRCFSKPLKVFCGSVNDFLERRNTDMKIPGSILTAEECSRWKDAFKNLAEHPDWILDSNKTTKAGKDKFLHERHLLSGDWDDLEKVSGVVSGLKDLRIIPLTDEQKVQISPYFDSMFSPHETKKGVDYYIIKRNADEKPILCQLIASEQLNAYGSFLRAAAKRIAEDMRSSGRLTFFDSLLYLRDMLAEDAKTPDRTLTKHIAGRHRYFLVDEFQDTNPLQAQIMFYLTAKTGSADWKQCVPGEGQLFIVGDPKQSIYRFNHADVESYLEVSDLFAGSAGEVLQLESNFRSTDKLCAWFNKICPFLLGNTGNNGTLFTEIPLQDAFRDDGTFGGVYMHYVEKKRGAPDPDPDEIAEIIERIVRDPDKSIAVRDGQPRRPTYRDFMVLTHSKSKISDYLTALQARGIPVRVSGDSLFNDCPSLGAVTHLMAGMADPRDRSALYRAQVLSGCDPDPAFIKECAKRAYGMPPSAMVRFVIDTFRVFDFIDKKNDAYLYYALELLGAAEQEGTVTNAAETVSFFEDLISKENRQERCIELERDRDCVFLANLHKVKGLQAPIVILAGCSRSTFTPSFRDVYVGQEPPLSYLLSAGIGEDFIKKTIRAEARSTEMTAEIEANDAEHRRVLYVAATRAQNALIITEQGTPNEISDKSPWYELADPDCQDIMAALPVPSEDMTEEPEDGSGPETPADAHSSKDAILFPDASVFEPSFKIIRPSLIRTAPRVSSAEDAPQEITAPDVPEPAVQAADGKSKKYRADLIGTMVHKLMELLVLSQGGIDIGSTISRIVRTYEPDQADEAYFLSILKNVADTMQSGGYKQENGSAADLLVELKGAEVHCEIPFCLGDPDSGETVNGVIDLLYRKDGQWHIVDYKTNDDGTALDGRYADQLAAYRKVCGSFGIDADTRIYHIRVGADRISP